MSWSGASQTGRMLHVDITPMIDIVFLLIVFFLTTAQYTQLNRARLDLPVEAGEQQEYKDEAGLVVNIDREGNIIVAGETVLTEELASIVREEVSIAPSRDATQVRVLIRADRAADIAIVNKVVSLMREEGIGVVRFGTEVPEDALRS